MDILLVLLGVGAGALTTLAGMGGGILLLLALSLVLGPHEALATTTPALFLSNIHRLVLFRNALDRRVALAFALGALPGSLLGGLLVSQIKAAWIQAAMLTTTLVAVAQRLGWLRWRPDARWISPAGAGIGVISATAGGAGMLVSPVLMASGLIGNAYVAGTAAAGVALHAGRMLSYGASGMISGETLGRSALLVGALLVGNLAGVRLRRTASEGFLGALELGTLLLCSALALVGAA